jgi:hypothetical protein
MGLIKLRCVPRSARAVLKAECGLALPHPLLYTYLRKPKSSYYSFHSKEPKFAKGITRA